MSKYGVISSPYFPVKYGPEITPYLDTFHAVSISLFLVRKKFKISDLDMSKKKHPRKLLLLHKMASPV